MTDAFDDRKARASAWFADLRDRICGAFERLEDELDSGPHATLPPARFERRPRPASKVSSRSR